MAVLEHEQRRRKAFADQHRDTKKKHFKIGKVMLVFQTRMGQMLGKLRFIWTGPYWIIGVKKWDIRAWHTRKGCPTPKVQWFST